MKNKFKNGSSIETIESKEIYRSSRYKWYNSYFKKYPDKFMEEMFGVRLSFWERVALRWNLRIFTWLDRAKSRLRRMAGWKRE